MENKKNDKNIIRALFFFTVMLFSMLVNFSIVHADSSDYAALEITLLNQDPDPAKQGEYLDVRWKVVKTGNANMDDLRFLLDIDYPFSLDAGETLEKGIGDWIGKSDDKEYYTLHYKLRVDDDALEDSYTVKLKWKSSKSDAWIEEEYTLRVGDKTEPEFVLGTLETSPTKLLADTDENQLKVTLENIGDENAEVVSMDLELPEGFTATYGYSTRANLGSIAAGSNAEGTFYVNLDEAVMEGEYEGKVIVKYKEADDDDNEYKSVELPLSIPVNGKPMYTIDSIKTTPEVIRAGDDVTLLLTISNSGTKEADSVSVRAFKESSQPFDFDEKSDFIGKLNPGESGEAVLKLTVDSDANAKTYLLDLEVRGIYNDEVITENEVIPIKIENGESHSLLSDMLGYIIIIAIVVIGLAVYYFLKKKK